MVFRQYSCRYRFTSDDGDYMTAESSVSAARRLPFTATQRLMIQLCESLLFGIRVGKYLQLKNTDQSNSRLLNNPAARLAANNKAKKKLLLLRWTETQQN